MKSFRFYFLLALTFISIGFKSSAQVEFAEDKVKWKFSVQQNEKCETYVVGEAVIEPHWHINALYLPKGSFGYPTAFKVDKSANFKIIGKATEPKPKEIHDDIADEDLVLHEGKVLFKQRIELLTDKDITVSGTYAFQPCDETHCLAPYEGTFKVTVKACGKPEEASINNTTGTDDTPTSEKVSEEENTAQTLVADKLDENKRAPKPFIEDKKSSDNDLEKKSLVEIFFIAFGFGLLALITPCMFPMIPMTVSFFTKRSKNRKTGIKNALLYGLSIILIYVILGTIVTAVTKDSQAVNNVASNPYLNIFFFLLLIIFAISFLGAFEIRLPNSWVNKADSKADKGGIIGIFFMALVLALVSFSCTGPFVGNLLVVAVEKGGIAPIIGMVGFSSAIALPFALFAFFPSWLNSLPQSGGWLNTVKVVLGLLELAFAFKFLSNADFTWQTHFLEREVFIALWIGIFLTLALYLFGFIRFPHDDKTDRVSVGRGVFGIVVLSFVFYMIPGLWGAPLKLINAFPPPQYYSESPRGLGSATSSQTAITNDYVEGMELGPQGLNVFHDFDKALAYSKQAGKPLFVDFTGFTCVNCRKMEESVWGEPGIIEHLKKDVVIVSLHTDDRKELPKDEQVKVELVPGKFKTLRTYGDKWGYMEIKEFNVSAQPYYVMYDAAGNPMRNIGSATYDTHKNPDDFRSWLENGLAEYKKK